MTPEQAAHLQPGDRVRHIMLEIGGEVVRVEGPFIFSHDHQKEEPRYRVHWKGWCTHDPERVDWTWDGALCLEKKS